MKYIKKFDSNTQYNTFKQSEQYIKPNLSSCELETEIHFENIEDPNKNILTFVAQKRNSTIKLRHLAFNENEMLEETDSNDYSIEYSLNNSEWYDYDLNSVIELENFNDNVKFRGINSTLTTLSVPSIINFEMTGKIKAKGDVTSLLNGIGGDVDLSNKEYCFANFFGECTALSKAPNLPSTVLSEHCYEGMFALCTSLTTPPELPATTLAGSCYYGMFQGCTSLTAAPELPATVLSESCYSFMFEGCKKLKTAPELPATTLGYTCYSAMFSGCTSLETPPNLPATQLTQGCYSFMFEGCTSLTFSGFTSNEHSGNTYALIAETAIASCYAYMFHGCTKLEATPDIRLTTLQMECCSHMFEGCTSLKQIIGMPAATMKQKCYEYMFKDCSSLVISPTLGKCDFTGSTTTDVACFSHMFDGIKELRVDDDDEIDFYLSASALSESCYEYMFANTKINAFYLPAIQLVSGCYNGMFEHSNIGYLNANFITLPGESYTYNWLNDTTHGYFDGNLEASWANNYQCGPSTIPCDWDTNMYAEAEVE